MTDQGAMPAYPNKAKLVAEIAKLRKQLGKIESAEREAENAGYVGRCFRYRNCYSCPETDKDYWYSYTRILSADDSGLRGFQFQTDKYGDVRIQPNTWSSGGELGEEITLGAFNAELSALQRSLAKKFLAALSDQPTRQED